MFNPHNNGSSKLIEEENAALGWDLGISIAKLEETATIRITSLAT